MTPDEVVPPSRTKVEEEFLDLLKDAKIGKRKHFHAAQRKQAWHMRLGIGALLLTSMASIISAVSEHLADALVGVAGMALPASAAVLVGLQTFLRLEKMIEGHRTIANGYLELNRDGKAHFAKRLDGRMSIEELDVLFDQYRIAYHKLNRDSEAFSTNPQDLAVASSNRAMP